MPRSLAFVALFVAVGAGRPVRGAELSAERDSAERDSAERDSAERDSAERDSVAKGNDAKPDALSVRFQFDAGAPLLAPAGVAPDGPLCVGTSDGYIHLLDADGAYRWSYSVHGAVMRRPLFVDPLWYVATAAHRIYALTRRGALRWVFASPSAIESELSTDPAGRVSFVTKDGVRYGLNGRGGIAIRIPSVHQGPQISGENYGVLPTSEPLEVEVVDPARRRWSVSSSGRVAFGPDAARVRTRICDAPLLRPAWSLSANYLVVSSRNGVVFAVDPPLALSLPRSEPR